MNNKHLSVWALLAFLTFSLTATAASDPICPAEHNNEAYDTTILAYQVNYGELTNLLGETLELDSNSKVTSRASFCRYADGTIIGNFSAPANSNGEHRYRAPYHPEAAWHKFTQPIDGIDDKYNLLLVCTAQSANTCEIRSGVIKSLYWSTQINRILDKSKVTNDNHHQTYENI